MLPKQARIKAGKTVRDICRITKKSRPSITRYELGQVTPPPSVMVVYEKFGVTAGDWARLIKKASKAKAPQIELNDAPEAVNQH